jgi:protein tyrosine/serine phosphatase
VKPLIARQLHFEGMVNFRDLGGLPAEGGAVRSGVLFRSDSLAYATKNDANRLVDEFGLATVIDLRGAYEVERLGRGPLAETKVKYVHAPIVDVTRSDELARHYLAILDERGTVLADLVRLLTEPAALPAVFHCEAGCDRTGVFAAVVLGLIGVTEDEIASDYELTAPAMPEIHARIRRTIELLGLPPRDIADWAPQAQMMVDTLALVRERWGGIDAWAAAHGLSEEDIARLRTALIRTARAENVGAAG